MKNLDVNYQRQSPEDVLSKRSSQNFLKNSQENSCARISFLTKLLAWHRSKVPTLLKKRPQHRYFPVNFGKFLRISFLIEQLQQLQLYYITQIHMVHVLIFFTYIYHESQKLNNNDNNNNNKKTMYHKTWVKQKQ